VLSSALLFTLATTTRSMLASYIGVLVLVMGYLVVTTVLGNQPEYQDALARFEPLAIGAIFEVSRYWTAAEMNTQAIPIEGNLLFNRLFALGLAAAFLALAAWRFSMTERAPSRWRLARLARAARGEAKAEAVRPRAGMPRSGPRFGAGYVALSFWIRLKAETLLVLKSPGLVVLLLIALAMTIANLAFSQTLYGTASYPLTANVVTTVIGSMSLFTLIVAVFYGGELVWRERDVRINEIIDAAPVPGWAVFVPKILAILAVLLTMSLAGMLSGLAYQMVLGAEAIDMGLYLVAYVLPQSIDLLLIAVLSVFFQVLSPSK
jgi:hypothetical protein